VGYNGTTPPQARGGVFFGMPMTDVEFVCDLAQRAGTLAQAAIKTLVREVKPDQSIVTNIDRAIEELVRSEVLERFPGDAFYGEETGGDPLAAERLWVVDPIDGTTNMVFGLPIWGVSIGLAVRGEPALGAFHMPRIAETYWFEKGKGAYLNGERLQAEDTGALIQEDTVGIGSEAIFVLDFHRFNCRQRNMGSLAAHWCYAAAGAFRANISVRDRLHDLGAAYGIAAEAGCAVEYLEGGEVPFSRFLTTPLNLRPLMVGHPGTLDRIRGTLREKPSGIDNLGE
jgi:fructose-1,6-bisphosphatase/inositol monophosphatase family enzyme